MGGMTMPDGYTLGTGPFSYDNIKYAKDNTDIIKVTVVDSRGNSSTTELKVNIAGVFFQAYITGAKATRADGNGKKVKLTCTGKISDYESTSYPNKNITINYTVRDKNNTTTLQTGVIAQENITYNEDNTFKVDSYIKGDIGAEGFTQDVEFIVNLTCAGQLFTTYPTNYNNILVDKGKILQDITEQGYAYGGLYDTNLGGALQVNNARVDYNIEDNKEIALPYTQNNKKVYLKLFAGTFAGKENLTIQHNLENCNIIKIEAVQKNTTGITFNIPSIRAGYAEYNMGIYVTATEIVVETTGLVDRTGQTANVTLYYTKN